MQPFLAHGGPGTTVQQDRPECAVFGHIVAEGAKTGFVVIGPADRQGQFVELLDLVFGDVVKQCILRLMMAKEGGVVDAGFRADVTDGDPIERFSLQQRQEGFAQCMTRPHGTRVLGL